MTTFRIGHSVWVDRVFAAFGFVALFLAQWHPEQLLVAALCLAVLAVSAHRRRRLAQQLLDYLGGVSMPSETVSSVGPIAQITLPPAARVRLTVPMQPGSGDRDWSSKS